MKCKERKYQFMRNQAKKAFSLLLALVMCLGMLPGMAWATDGEVTVSTNEEFYNAMEDLSTTKVTLDADVTIAAGSSSGTGPIERSGDVVLDLNSHTINVKDTFAVASGTMTVTGNGTITSNVSSGYANAVVLKGSGSMSLENGTIVGKTNGILFYNASCSGTLTVNGGEISGTTGIKLYGASSVVVNGGNIEGTGYQGVSIDNHGTGTVTVNDGATLTGGTGAIYNYSSGSVVVTGGTLTSTDSMGAGYGVQNTGSGSVTISGGTIQYNLPDSYQYPQAGAVSNNTTSGTTTISGGTINGKLYNKSGGTLAISGGTFDHDPTTYVVEGYEATPGNNLWTVGPATPAVTNVASITRNDDTTEYATLQAAVEAAQDGDTIKLLGNVTYGEDHEVAVWEKDFDLDLNGHTFTTNSNQSITANNNGYKATAICFGDYLVMNSPREISISNGTIRTAYGAGVYLDGAVTATLSDLDVKQNYPANVQTTDEYSAAIRLTSNATVIVRSGSYEGRYAIAVSNSGGDVTVNGGTFTGDIFFSNSTSTGAVKTITINGGAFKGNIVNSNKGTLIITGGVFSKQPASEYLAAHHIVIANTDAATRVAYPFKVVESNSQVTVQTVQVDMTGSASATMVVNVPNNYEMSNLNGGVEAVTTTKTVKATVGEDNQGRPTITANVPAKDMGAVMTVYDNGQPVYTTSIKQYLTTLKSDTTYGAKATASYNYGTAAATYFGTAEKYGYTSTDANELSEAIKNVTADSVSTAPNAPVVGNTTFTVGEGLTYIGMSLLLEDNTSVRLNFRGNGEDYSLVPVSTSTGTKYPVRRGNTDYWYIEVATDIGPAAYGTPYIVYGNETATVSALSYVKAILTNADNYDTNLVNLAKALYKCYDVYKSNT